MKKTLSNKKSIPLLAVGSVAYDSIETPFTKVNKTLGGSASFFSLAASYFIKPGLVAVVGDDFKETSVFKKKKIDVSGLEKTTGKTFHWAGKYHFDLNTRDTLKTELGVFENFKPNLLPHHQQAQYVFLGNIHPSLQLEVLSQIKNPKLVGLDTMNFWIERAPSELKKVLSKVDVFIINDTEARELSKEHNLLKAAKKILGMMTRTPSLNPSPLSASGEREKPNANYKTRGYGLLMFTYGGNKNLSIFHLPGFPLEDVIDPTGAGDTFAGGFMGYLAKANKLSAADFKKACVYGSVMASFCVEKFGTQRLQDLKPSEINSRYKEFVKLTGF